ncbi:MAG TPA: D-alanyl-D-alanine carboxypeptidase family protein, partial [Candidatus Saccharimonadales bacterium]|nr:D-alanyl-D-alanine carboxypeptidase family protein [Candidatus Saccharimonadales bacterium]
IDVINHNGVPDDFTPQLFEETIEYAWLGQNASIYGFNLSYPRANTDGVDFEPWHWRYTG